MDLNLTLKPILLDCASSAKTMITGVQFHSGKVEKGDVFVAIPGAKVDGHKYIQDAIRAGAVAIVGEKDLSHLQVPYYRVANARLALAEIANELYDNPSRLRTMIGITGTNGKTTTAHILRHILEVAGHTCSLIGTVSNHINGQVIPSTQTTPDVLQLQKWLKESRDQVFIMEVSSHGIDQHRVSGISYDYAVFTNLSHDHLDYHKTMADYFYTKAQLFKQMKRNGEAIINSRGEWGARLLDHLMTEDRTVFSYGETVRDHLEIVQMQSEYPLQFQLREGDHYYDAAMSLPGSYNAWNTAAAWLTARRMGIPPSVIKRALVTFTGVPGRFEVFSHPKGAQFIVDYAHTPDGFAQFLQTLHQRRKTRIIHIFGFRGNGDPSKRRLMFANSAARSDLIILTLDDLKGMNAKSNVKELQKFADEEGLDRCIVIEDRTKAIEYAWHHAENGDLVAITGKGREVYEQKFRLPTRTDIDTLQYLQTI